MGDLKYTLRVDIQSVDLQVVNPKSVPQSADPQSVGAQSVSECIVRSKIGSLEWGWSLLSHGSLLSRIPIVPRRRHTSAGICYKHEMPEQKEITRLSKNY